MAPSRRKQGKPSSTSTGAQKPKFGQATAQNRRKGETVRLILGAGLILYLVYLYFNGKAVKPPLGRRLAEDTSGHVNLITTEEKSGRTDESEGHWDFGDGRKTTVDREFLEPKSHALHWVNVMLGNGGPEPDLSGGMIPAVAPPFAMTRWTPQTRQNYVSMCPYNQTDTLFHGFLGTHQPAIWMGESGPAQISAGIGEVETTFQKRGLPFMKEDEYASANYYRTVLDAGEDGTIGAELTASSRVGHMRFRFNERRNGNPHIVIQASRESVVMSGDNVFTRTPHNVSYPQGWIKVDRERKEVYGWNDERQDRILLGEELPAASFKGYFVARFSEDFESLGVSHRGVKKPGQAEGKGEVLAGYVTFPLRTGVVNVRVGVSFISVEQARRNLDTEIPDGQPMEATSRQTRSQWVDKLDRLSVTGATRENRTVLYSSYAHTLVYPYEVHEPTPSGPAYYSGYLDKVVSGESYSGYSLWDTFRAQTAWLLLVAPERVAGMINSMLQDYEQGGWLPMWKNLVETNIMVGTHADSVIAQAISAGVKGVDWNKAWEAAKKNSFVPPDRDTELRFEDREEHTPQEARAGLTEYMKIGYVAHDLHDESASRTLEYAYNDWAASIVAEHVGADEEAALLRARAKNYRNIWNVKTGFMEAKNSDGSWAGPKSGWTEGDHWAYSLTVMHDVPGLIKLMGGNESFVRFMDDHFENGHNKHTNEPSHHIPYLYMYAGVPSKAQARVMTLGRNEYNHTAGGLSGNEDCGQMSAWYIFSAFGFYPVDPASAEYVFGVPFFDSITLRLPGKAGTIHIDAKGVSDGKPYIKGVRVNGEEHNGITLKHNEIADGAKIVFVMEQTPQTWAL